MSSFARSAKPLESHGIFAITRPSLQGADRRPGSGDKCPVECGYRLEHVHLCKRTETAFVVPVLLQQPIAFAVIRTPLAILAPVMGMLVLPAVLAVSLVGPIIGIRGEFVTLPLRFSGPLAGLVGQKRWVLTRGFGSTRHWQWAQRMVRFMASSCAKPAIAKNGFYRKNKNYNQSRCGRKYTIEKCEKREEKLCGQFSERCPWFTFSPVILADFPAGDNTPHFCSPHDAIRVPKPPVQGASNASARSVWAQPAAGGRASFCPNPAPDRTPRACGSQRARGT